MKAARAALAAAPEARVALERDARKAGAFYVRFGITASQLWRGAPELDSLGEDLGDILPVPCDWMLELHAREFAVLPDAACGANGPTTDGRNDGRGAVGPERSEAGTAWHAEPVPASKREGSPIGKSRSLRF